MDETIALIDMVITEHEAKIDQLKTLEQVTNDALAIEGLGKAKEAFMPGRLEQREPLENLQIMLETIDQGLQAHFSREEGAVLTAFEKYAAGEVASAFRSLLLEHKDLLIRMSRSMADVAELIGGGLSRHFWEASAYDMRAYISHTQKLVGSHAASENKLLKMVRNELVKAQQGDGKSRGRD